MMRQRHAWLTAMPVRLTSLRPVSETMEPRILHSADLAPLVVADAAGGIALQQVVQQPANDAASRSSEIVFVDLSVPDAQTLLDDLTAQRDNGRVLEIITISAHQDGLALITDTLAARSDISAVHVLAHGNDGRLQLGSVQLDGQSLMQRADQVASWSRGLTGDADLLLYGCDFAQTGVGQQLVRDLALLTGADVAASTDLTGAATLGGNWTLEFSSGQVDAANAISGAAQQRWASTMAVAFTSESSGGTTSNTTSFAFSHNVNGGSDRLLLVHLVIKNGVNATAVNFNGAALTLLARQDSPTGHLGTEIWYRVAPIVTSGTVTVTLASASTLVAGATSYSGVDQTTPLAPAVTAAGTSFLPVTNVSSASGDLVVDVIGATAVSSHFVGPGQTQSFELNQGTGATDLYGESSREAGGGSVAMGHVFIGSNFNWAAIGVAINQTGSAAVAQLTAVQDTYIRSAGTTSNYGNSTSLVVDRSGGSLGNQRALLQFDLSTIPVGATITGATLQMQATQNSGAFNVNVYRVTESWVEGSSNGGAGQANWNNRAPGQAWASAGGTVDSATIHGTSSTAATGPHSWDLTTLVRGWQLGTFANYGLMLASPQTGTTTVTYDSSEGTTPPRLRVTYTMAPNVAPVITSNGTLAYTENEAAKAVDASLTVTDVDSPNMTGATVSISGNFASGQDVLAFTNQNGISGSYNAGAGVLTLTGTSPLANYQTALRSITYANISEAPSTLTRTVSIVVSEGAVSSNTATRSISVTAVNDAPVLSGANNLVTILEDPVNNGGTLVAALISGRVSDVDGGALTGIAVPAVNNSNGRWEYTLNGGTNWSVFGAPTASSARLLTSDAATAVRFVPNANWNGVVANGISFRAWDRSTGSAGGLADTATAGTHGGASAHSAANFSASIVVTSVNDAPQGSDNTISATEDTLYTFAASDFGFTDPLDIVPNNFNAVQIVSLPVAGTLRIIGGDDAGDVGVGQIILFADIDSGNFVFSPASDASGTGYASFTFRVRDNGGTADGGIRLEQTSHTMLIDVSTSNDAPVIAAPVTQTTAFDAPIEFSNALGNLIAVSDVDAALANMQLTLTATNGTLALSGFNGLSVDAGADGTSAITVTGNLNDLNAALNGLLFTPTTSFVGDAVLTLQLNDLGNSGLGGARIDNRFITITVQASTSLVLGDDNYATPENSILTAPTVLGNDSDPDLGNVLTVVSVNGDAAAIGASILLPSGAQLSMNPDGSFTYDPNGAFDTLAQGASAQDSFNYGVHSTSLEVGNATVRITINGINTAPVLIGGSSLLGVAEDSSLHQGTLVSALIAGRASDADTGAADGIAVVGADNTHGAWQYSTDGGPTWIDFDTPAPNNVRLLAANTLTLVRFVPNANWNGTVAGGLIFRAWDQTSGVAGNSVDLSGALAVGGSTAFSSATASSSIVVTPVNDAPTGADKTIALDEDGTYVFKLADFGFSDFADSPAGNLFSIVHIDDLPLNGQLSLGTIPVSAGQTVAVSDIALNRLRFTPNANENAVVYASFRFRVQDDGGSDDGGKNTDVSARTMTMRVDAVNDAPEIATPFTIDVVEDLASQIKGIEFSDLDAYVADVRASFSVGSGTLSATTGGGVTVTGGGSSMSLQGSVANLNSFIAQGGLTFTTDAHATADVTLTVRIDDRGNTGSDPGITGTATSESATTLVTLVVAPVNDAPTLALGIANRLATQGAAFSYTVPADRFADVDVGDSLRYSAALSSGSALPSWLSFDAATRTFSGTPANGDVGSISVRVTATDLAQASAFGDFMLTVANINDAPTLALAIANQSVTEDIAFSFTVPADRFADVDIGDSLRYGATLSSGAALPSWLSFDAATRTFSGTPANGDVGSISVRVTATDLAQASAFGDFMLTVTNVNDAPAVISSSGALATNENAPPVAIDPGLVLTDVDNTNLAGATVRISNNYASDQDTLVFVNQNGISGSFDVSSGVLSLSGVATLLDYQGALRSVSYANTSDTPSTALRTVSFNISDGLLTSSTATRNVNVAAVNDGPTITAPASFLVTEDVAVALTGIRFDDIDAGTGMTTATFTVTAGTLSAVSTADVTVGGGAGRLTLGGSLTAINSFIDRGALRFVTAPDAVADVGLGITFDDGGSPGANGVRSANASAMISVLAVNDAPRLVAPPADQNAETGVPARFQIPAASFADPDIGDDLRYSATLVDGVSLPPWLQFDPATRSFTATPDLSHIGVIQLRVVATDNTGAFAQTHFNLFVAGPLPVSIAESNQTPQPLAETNDEDSPKSAGKTAIKSVDDAVEAIEEPITALIKLDIASDGATAAAATADTRDSPVVQIDASAPAVQRPLFQFGDVLTSPVTNTQPVLAAALLSQLSDITLSSARQTFVQNTDVLRTLEELRRQMAQQGDPQQLQTLSAIALSSGLSIGYVVWLIRGGILVSSMLSALPAWQMIDPLPVITSSGRAKGKGPDTDSDDPQVERLFDKRSRAAASRPGQQTTQNDNAMMQEEKST